jgi:hypothetical protein
MFNNDHSLEERIRGGAEQRQIKRVRMREE